VPVGGTLQATIRRKVKSYYTYWTGQWRRIVGEM